MGHASAGYGRQNFVFPYMKVRLLFFMLMENRTISRERLCYLLWEDDRENARQNLRNALSRLRHIVPPGFLRTDRRTISVNPEWPVDADLELLSVETLTPDNLQRVAAPFLEDVDPSDPCFPWVAERRRHYRKKLLSCLERKLSGAEEPDRAFWQTHIELLKSDERRPPDTTAEPPAASPSSGRALSFEESELTDCVAIFKAEAPFEDLKKLSELDDMTLLRLYEALSRKKILERFRDDDGSFAILFAEPSLKQQILEAMQDIKRWKLNQRLVAILRERLTDRPDRGNLALLAHYARECGDMMTALEAEIRSLQLHFELAHELFPNLSDAELTDMSPSVNDFQFTEASLNRIRSMLDRLIRQMGRTERLIEFERMILTLHGSFFRWTGKYGDALNCLEEAIKLACTSGNRSESILSVLEQLCYLGLQKDDSSLLRRYAFNFYRQALHEHMHPALGMALRFLAVMNIMEERYESAEKLLDMSIRVFEKLETRGSAHTLSLIAAVQYKGDIALHRRNHGAAFELYLRCVRLCEDKGFRRVQGLHLGKLSWCAMRLGRVEETKKYLDSAALLIDRASHSWGSGMYGGELIFALSALLNLREGRTEEAAVDLRKAVAMSTVIQKPFWNALFFCLLALLKKRADPEVTKCLDESAEYYLNESGKLFDHLCLSHEIEACGQMEELLWGDRKR